MLRGLADEVGGKVEIPESLFPALSKAIPVPATPSWATPLWGTPSTHEQESASLPASDGSQKVNSSHCINPFPSLDLLSKHMTHYKLPNCCRKRMHSSNLIICS